MSDKHFVTFREAEGGFYGVFGLPGGKSELVIDRSGNPEIFDTQAAALANAGICLCARLNGARVRQAFVSKQSVRHPRKITLLEQTFGTRHS